MDVNYFYHLLPNYLRKIRKRKLNSGYCVFQHVIRNTICSLLKPLSLPAMLATSDR